jgi:hypothetical protein
LQQAEIDFRADPTEENRRIFNEASAEAAKATEVITPKHGRRKSAVGLALTATRRYATGRDW